MSSTLSVRDVCKRYAVSEGTVRSWVRAGLLRGIDVSRRQGSRKPRLRFSESSLEAFELARSTAPTMPRGRRQKRRPAETIEFYK